MRTFTTAVSTTMIAIALFASGCQKKNEVPQELRGRYRLIQLLGSNNTITVDAHSINVADCNVNCGDPVLTLTTVSCDNHTGYNVCSWTSERCTGTMEKSGTSLSIRARPVPGATGEEQGRRFMTCNNIDGTMGPI